MSNDQLKAIVIERVLFTQDEAILQDVLKRLTATDPKVVRLTQAQRDSVQAGLADYAAGRLISDDELEGQDAAEWR